MINKFSDAVKVNQNFKELRKDLELIKESATFTKQEIQKINNHLDESKIVSKLDKKSAPVLTGWAHVEDITESDRYPLVETSEPAIEVETQVLLKKLDVI